MTIDNIPLSGEPRMISLYQPRINYKKMVVMAFHEDEVPVYSQGYVAHELIEPVTAEQCNNMVGEIDRLRRLCAANGIDANKTGSDWVSSEGAWVDSFVENTNGVYTAGISCPSWGHMIQAHSDSKEQALALITLVHTALSNITPR